LDGSPRPPSADDFLPVLIWVVVQAQPMRLFLNVQYTSSFIDEEAMRQSPGYLLTHLCSAMTYIEQCDGASLNGLDADQFDALFNSSAAAEAEQHASLAAAAAEAANSNSSLTTDHSSASSSSSSSPTARASPPGKETEDNAQHTPAQDLDDSPKMLDEQTRSEIAQLELSFMTVSIDELRLAQVPHLLDEYKRMARVLQRLRRPSGGGDKDEDPLHLGEQEAPPNEWMVSHSPRRRLFNPSSTCGMASASNDKSLNSLSLFPSTVSHYIQSHSRRRVRV
jgi:hypothetical protein